MGSGNTIQETVGTSAPTTRLTLTADAVEIWHVRENRILGYIEHCGASPDPPIYVRYVETDGGSPASATDFTYRIKAGERHALQRREWAGAVSIIGTAGTVVNHAEIY